MSSPLRPHSIWIAALFSLILSISGRASAGITPAQLLTELTNDPQALGYAPLITAGKDADLVRELNLQRAGAAFRIDRENIPTYVLFASIDPTEFAALTSLQLQQLQTILSAGQVDLSKASIRTILLTIFPGGGPTATALTAIAKRQGSRAEVLGGIGTVITQSDISKALRGTQ